MTAHTPLEGDCRPAAVAGTFYPESAAALRTQVLAFLNEAECDNGEVPKAIVAPHAGFIYSGPIAASVYRRLIPAAQRIRRVVLLGPSHRVSLQGLASGTWQAFETPLGRIPVDLQALAPLLREGLIDELDQAHALEHSLEVQLPFLQTVLENFQLVPLVVGQASPEQVGAVLERLWDGPQTLIVISSDLSHYLPYTQAQRRDAATSKAIENLDYKSIGWEDACGRAPLSGLLWLAQRHGLSARTVDLRNSGDTAGDRDRVVGYGGYAFD